MIPNYLKFARNFVASSFQRQYRICHYRMQLNAKVFRRLHIFPIQLDARAFVRYIYIFALRTYSQK